MAKKGNPITTGFYLDLRSHGLLAMGFAMDMEGNKETEERVRAACGDGWS